MEPITKQNCQELVYIMHYKDNERDAWYYVLVLYDKMSVIKKFERGRQVNIKNCCRYIEYRDEQGMIKRVCGFGTDPPIHIVDWITYHYGPAAVDENTTLIYTVDDIRLCTIQRSSLQQPIGVDFVYHNHEQFHYVNPANNFRDSLASRAGIKCYDRLIELNGTNMENDSCGKLQRYMTIAKKSQPTVQLLVCSPATYAHYKTNNKPLHSNLDTVTLMRPVRNDLGNMGLSESANQIISGRGEYCAIRWKETNEIGVVPISSIRKAPSRIRLYELYTVVNNSQCHEGQIIFKGSKIECEMLLPATDADCHANMYQDAPNYVEDRNKQSVSNATALSVPNNEPAEKKVSEMTVKDEKKEIAKRDRIIVQLVGMLMNVAHGDNDDAHRVPCDGCHALRIHSDRYKCLQCDNYDLCGGCFEKRRETKQHQSGHAFAHFKMPMELFGEPITKANDEVTLAKFKERFATMEHHDVTCDGCERTPITGIRFKCDTCHDYDLCLECMEKQVVTNEHDAKHSLVVIGKDRFNQIDINDIELGDELGRGGFGAVHKAKWISKNRQVACKVLTIPPDKQHLEKSFLRELAAYTEVSGAYILKLYGFAIQTDPTNGTRKCLLIMELMSRGSLANVITQEKKISLRRKLEMACHIASGMRKLHARHMIHRDIRPDNILVNENYTAKIGDMGIARVMEENEHLTIIGCGHYMPPEFITGKYDQSLDIFTFGLTLNHLFTEKQHHSIQFIITKVKLVEESPILNELIARCIHDDPSQRPSAVEIEATLHAYKRGFDKLVLSEHLGYIQLSTEDKNKIFLKFYEAFHPHAKAALERRFPPPPPPAARAEADEGIDLCQILSHVMNKLVEKPENK